MTFSCAADAPGVDAGPTTGGAARDAASDDASSADASLEDAQTPDATSEDGGSSSDAGNDAMTETDGGPDPVSDLGRIVRDAGPPTDECDTVREEFFLACADRLRRLQGFVSSMCPDRWFLGGREFPTRETAVASAMADGCSSCLYEPAARVAVMATCAGGDVRREGVVYESEEMGCAAVFEEEGSALLFRSARAWAAAVCR